MKDDLIINKINTINKCIVRIKEEYQSSKERFRINFTIQDAVMLNLERASQAAIDIAAHIVRIKKLGVPQTNRDVFVFLEKNGFISKKIGRKMQGMVGFRNLAVHDYQNLNLDIIIEIIEKDLDDFIKFTDQVLKS
jgi:uncharacterized protein YutE (UPF0331/DUF86 family)